MLEITETLDKIDTFTEKNLVIKHIEEPKPIEDTSFWGDE